MTQPVIDTLRLSDRLKESGFQSMQAEGLARALGDEFTDRVATKTDLDSAVQAIRADYRALDEKSAAKSGALDEKFDARFGAFDEKIDTRFGALDEKIEARFGALDEKIETRIGALDEKFDARFDSSNTQIKFMFAALAALLALGLIDTVQGLLG